MKYALYIIGKIRNKAGIKYAIVCADEQAVDFYRKIGFAPLMDIYIIPREQWNSGCIPMYINLTRGNEPHFQDEDDDDD